MALTDAKGNPVTMEDVKFHIPGNMCCYGPTCSGKTTWICDLLSGIDGHFYTKNNQNVKRVVYCYNSIFQERFKPLQKKGVEFKQGLPSDVESLFPPSKQPGILVLDDLMSEVNSAESTLHTVTVTAHHSNIFLIVTQQCLHPRGKNAVQLRQNFHYKVMFPYPADKQNVKRFLSNCESGDQLKHLYDYYSRCCEDEGYHRYFIIAAHPLEKNRLATYRTNVLKSEGNTKILVDRKRLTNVQSQKPVNKRKKV